MQVDGTCSIECAKMVLEMENVSEKIYSILKKLATDLGVSDLDFKVERPKEGSHGDFSSNLALVLAKPLKQNPYDLALEIVKKIKLSDEFDKVEAVKPGFINFYLSKHYLAKQVQEIIQQGLAYGSVNIGEGKTASVEFISANPTGPLHIGNAKGGPLGDTIANILTKVGYKVTREYLHNDVGGQVDRLGEAIYFALHPDQLPESYEAQYQGEYLKELAEEVEESLSEESDLSQEDFIEKAGKIAVSLLLTEILKDCEDMGISFDKVTKESDLREKVPQVLEKIGKSLKENEGALWFAPNDDFLKDRETVVKKSDGNYTYFASDIAYHNQKMSENSLVVDILGSNHSGHVPRILAAIVALGYDTNNFRCILYQYVRLKRGAEVLKMSKRAGTFVTAREVLDEVGKDAFRFFLLMQNSSTHMDFDLELAKKKSAENPVFYVQYAYTRISSIFTKAGKEDFSEADYSKLSQKEEVDLIRKLIEFPSLVEDVSKTFAVNNLTTYAVDLASFFHKFYEKHQVVSKEGEVELSRLALLKATQITLKNTLDLLGVSAPERM